MSAAYLVRQLRDALRECHGASGHGESCAGPAYCDWDRVLASADAFLAKGKADRTTKPRRPLPAMSTKRAAQMREIGPARRAFVRAHPRCQIASPDCTGLSQHVHEPLSRGRGGDIADPTNWIAACDVCNGYVSDNPAWSEERGWLLPTRAPQ